MGETIRQGLVGFRANIRIWLWLFVGRVGLALLLTLPLLAVADSSLSNSTFASALSRSWSLDVLNELFSSSENLLTTFLVVLVFYSVLVFLLKQFVTGGICYSFLSNKRVTARDFFGESGRLFVANLKISLVMLAVYFVLVIIGSMLARLLPVGVFGHYGSAGLLTLIGRFAVVALVLAVGTLFSDLFRLRVTAYPDLPIGESFRVTFDFYRGRLVKCYGIYLVYAVPYGLLWLLIEWLTVQLTGGLGSMVGVILEMVLFQLCVLAQQAQSLLVTATLAPMLRKEHPGRFRQVVQGELQFD